MRQKGNISILVVILAVLLIGGAAYYFGYDHGWEKSIKNSQPDQTSALPEVTISPTVTPILTTDETANWKTYTNIQSGYSIKYPSDKYVRVICADEELLLRMRTTSDTEDTEDRTKDGLSCGRGGRYAIEVVTANSFIEPITDDYVNVKKEEIVLNGTTARKYISTKKPGAEGPIPDYSEDIYFDGDSQKHLIHFDSGVSQDLKEKILSTFKFTN